MTWGLTVPSRYLYQCSLLISKVLWHSPENKFTCVLPTCLYNEFEIHIFKNLQKANELMEWGMLFKVVKHLCGNKCSASIGWYIENLKAIGSSLFVFQLRCDCINHILYDTTRFIRDCRYNNGSLILPKHYPLNYTQFCWLEEMYGNYQNIDQHACAHISMKPTHKSRFFPKAQFCSRGWINRKAMILGLN